MPARTAVYLQLITNYQILVTAREECFLALFQFDGPVFPIGFTETEHHLLRIECIG